MYYTIISLRLDLIFAGRDLVRDASVSVRRRWAGAEGTVWSGCWAAHVDTGSFGFAETGEDLRTGNNKVNIRRVWSYSIIWSFLWVSNNRKGSLLYWLKKLALYQQPTCSVPSVKIFLGLKDCLNVIHQVCQLQSNVQTDDNCINQTFLVA